MITTEPRMTNLFLQLGLDASAEGIARFIREHQLATDVEWSRPPTGTMPSASSCLNRCRPMRRGAPLWMS